MNNITDTDQEPVPKGKLVDPEVVVFGKEGNYFYISPYEKGSHWAIPVDDQGLAHPDRVTIDHTIQANVVEEMRKRLENPVHAKDIWPELFIESTASES